MAGNICDQSQVAERRQSERQKNANSNGNRFVGYSAVPSAAGINELGLWRLYYGLEEGSIQEESRL